MPENIIADTSCLVLLEKIDKLDVLKKLFSPVLVTSTIADEFGSDLPTWVKIREAGDKKYQTLLQTKIDPGEASAIALAVEIGGLLILDDIKARKLALQLKLDYTGTLGILVDAKQNEYISSFRNVFEQIKRTNFYFSEQLEMKLLKMVNE